MSLINTMLRDLDTRRSTNKQTVLLEEVRSPRKEVVAPRVRRKTWVLTGLATLALAAILAVVLFLNPQARFRAQPSTPMPAQPAAAAAAKQAPPSPASTIVLQLPPPAQMLPLPGFPETELPPAGSAIEQTKPAAPPVRTKAPPTVVESRSDTRMAESYQPDALPAKPAARIAAAPSRKPVSEGKLVNAETNGAIEIQPRQVTTQERAEVEYRNGVAAYKQGHTAEAAAQFKAALREEPRHLAARQTLLSMQAEQGQWQEVQSILRQGLDLMPEQVSWAMALARIQVENGKLQDAWETLQRHLVHADRNAEYQGFAGVLLQRMQKPREAIYHYHVALQLKPAESRWWLGLGLALEADNRTAEAREAFQRARSTTGLTPQMAEVIDRKLR